MAGTSLKTILLVSARWSTPRQEDHFVDVTELIRTSGVSIGCNHGLVPENLPAAESIKAVE
jgi:hypothetical protein